MEKTAKVLQITVGGNAFTGVASFLQQYYRSVDREKVHFDFLFCTRNSMELVMNDPVFADSRFYVLEATKKNSEHLNYPLLIRKLTAVLKSQPYDIVHINTTAVGVTVCCVLAARLCGVKTVISHSHNAKVSMKKGAKPRNPLVQAAINVTKTFCPWLIRTSCDALFACSEEAGVTLFGQKGVTGKKFRVIRNAIDAEKYSVSAPIRAQIREQQQAGEKTVVFGHIGRFSPEKNHLFLLDVFRRLRAALPDAQLWIIGSGDEHDRILQKIADEGLGDAVRLLGQQKDVCRYLQGMDVFLFPSVTEGLGIVAIEAQAAALPVYASDAVPRDTAITDLIEYLPLSSGAAAWAEEILRRRTWEQQRGNTYQALVDSGYDIALSARQLQEFYLSCVN